MISISNRFLFIHVRKTGGIAVKKALDKLSCRHYELDHLWSINCLKPKLLTHHTTLKQYNELLDESFLNSLFKFSIIRNPWERLISLYFSSHRGDVAWNKERFKSIVNNEPTLKDYICINNSKYTKSESSDKIVQLDKDIEYLMRYENIESEFEEVQKLLGLEKIKLPFLNRSSRSDYKSYYDETLYEIVRCKFIQEIDFGKYSF